MRPRGALVGAATAALVLLPAGCGSKPSYKGGQNPPAAEGGVREPGVDINSLDELRGVVVRVGPDGFEPPKVSIQAGDSVAWKNVDTQEHFVQKLRGQGTDFRSRPLGNGQVFKRTFAKPGRIIVRGDTDPPSTMTVSVFRR